MAMAPKTSPDPTVVSEWAGRIDTPKDNHVTRPTRPESRRNALSDLDFDTFDYAHLEVVMGSLPSIAAASHASSSAQFSNGLSRKRALNDHESGAICMKRAAAPSATTCTCTCTFCPQNFSSLSELRAHTMSLHGDALRAMLRLHAHGDDRETRERKLSRLAQIMQMDVRGDEQQRLQAERILQMLAQEQQSARMPPRKRFRFCASVPEEDEAKADEERSAPCELLASVEPSQSPPVACSIKKEPVSFEEVPPQNSNLAEDERPLNHLPIRAPPTPMRCVLNRPMDVIIRPSLPVVIPVSKMSSPVKSNNPTPRDNPQEAASDRVERESAEERAQSQSQLAPAKVSPPAAKFFKSADRKSKEKMASGSVASSVISSSIKSAIASVTLSERERIKQRKSQKELAQRSALAKSAERRSKQAAKTIERHVTAPNPVAAPAPVQPSKKEENKPKEVPRSSPPRQPEFTQAQSDRTAEKEKLRDSRRRSRKAQPERNSRPRRERRSSRRSAKFPSPLRSDAEQTAVTPAPVPTEHMSMVSEQTSLVSVEVQLSSTLLDLDPDSIFMCSLCEMTFYCMEAYDEHLLQQHGHFTCHKCSVDFGSWLEYDSHFASRHAEASDPDIWGYFDQFLRTARDGKHKTYSVSDYSPSFST